MDDLDAASLAAAHHFFSTYYVPNNCVLTLVGDIEPRAGFRKVEKYFGHLERRPEPPRPAPVALAPHVGVPRASTSAPVPASTLYAVWRLPARGTRAFDAVEIALDILGGSQTSRLYRRLVREDRTSSGAGASAIPLALGNSLGFAYARALEGTPLPELEAALIEEIGRFGDEGPTAAEVDRTHVQFEREWLSQCSRFETRADLFSAYATLHNDPHLVNTRIKEYFSITPSEVREAARAWLRPDQRAVLEYHRGIGRTS
jgi:predicted Zn-dependent peptidase